MITINEINSTTLINDTAKLWAVDNIAYLNKPMTFFGSSTKVEKGSEKFDTYIMYLQPADKVSIKTLCIGAVASGCKAPCLISSGQLGMTVGQDAATKRTVLLLMRPLETQQAILSEVDKAERKAIKSGTPALFRLNGTSDINFDAIISERPQSLFYDYTKVLSRVRKNTLSNYDLTFSGSMFSAASKISLRKAVLRKYRIAVAYNTKGLKDDALPINVKLASFDDTDLRHLDLNVVGMLKRKGSNKLQRAVENTKSESFFVTTANVVEFNNIIARQG